MEIILKRIAKKNTYTIGRLFIVKSEEGRIHVLRELIASQWCNEKSSQANAWATSESSAMRWTRANSPRSITSATPWSRLGATFSAST